MKKVIGLKKLNIANSITAIRIIGTICLLFANPFTDEFFIIYTICGLSDVFDGLVARMTKTVSDFGAKLDSAADLSFYAVMVLKIFPDLIEILPFKIWYAVTIIVMLRLISYMTVAIKYKKFASLHTKLNKITGFAIFLIPYMLKTKIGIAYCITACTISGISTLHEVLLHLTSKEYKGQ